jgi:predicted phage tail protein
MDANLTFKEDHNRCMQKARAAEAQFRAHTRMHGIVSVRVRAVQIACVQAIKQYESKRRWDP